MADGQQRAHAKLFQVILFEDLYIKAKVLHRGKACGKVVGGQHIGRLVRQIAGKEHAFGDGHAGFCGLCGGFGIVHQQGDRARFGFGAGFMRVEVIAAQRQTQRDIFGAGGFAQQDGQRVLALRLGQLCANAAGDSLVRFGGGFYNEDGISSQTCGERQAHDVAVFCLFKGVALSGAGQRLAGQGVHFARASVHFTIWRDQNGQQTGQFSEGIKVCGVKADIGDLGHGGLLAVATRLPLASGPAPQWPVCSFGGRGLGLVCRNRCAGSNPLGPFRPLHDQPADGDLWLL